MANLDEILIDSSTLTIPLPEPYDDKNPNRQRENLAFVALQILQQFKQAGGKMSSRMLDGSLSQNISDLQYEGILMDLGQIKIIRTGKTGSVINT